MAVNLENCKTDKKVNGVFAKKNEKYSESLPVLALLSKDKISLDYHDAPVAMITPIPRSLIILLYKLQTRFTH